MPESKHPRTDGSAGVAERSLGRGAEMCLSNSLNQLLHLVATQGSFDSAGGFASESSGSAQDDMR